MNHTEKIKFVFATSDENYYITRLFDGETISADYYDFLQKEKNNNVVEGSMEIEVDCPLTLMVEPFWTLTTKEEKIQILNAAMKKYAGKPFDGAKYFGKEGDDLIPIYAEGNKTYLNISALDYQISPCVYLSSILSSFDDIKYLEYSNKKYRRINSILDFENIDDLKTNYIMTPVDMELSEKEFEEVTTRFYQDMPINRHRIYHIIDAAKMLLEEAHEYDRLACAFKQQMYEFAIGALNQLRAVHDVLDADDQEMRRLDKLYEMFMDKSNHIGALDYIDHVKNIFAEADKKRDAKYVERANENWNQLAKNKRRYKDVVDNKTALKHFGLLESELADESQQKSFDA